VLTELAPGARMREDILDQMGFNPQVAPNLKPMDSRLFCTGRMGLAEHLDS
jgi:propionate CoA-transferase